MAITEEKRHVHAGEQRAWDQYVSAAVAGILASQPDVSSGYAVLDALKVADRLLEERRKRQGFKTPV